MVFIFDELVKNAVNELLNFNLQLTKGFNYYSIAHTVLDMIIKLMNHKDFVKPSN